MKVAIRVPADSFPVCAPRSWFFQCRLAMTMAYNRPTSLPSNPGHDSMNTYRPSLPLAAAAMATGLATALLLAQRPERAPAAQAEPALFSGWPKDTKPDAVLVITGQTYGYLQPCGCSRPQLGGLERRAQFIASLKAKGWPVAGVDLGDIPPAAAVVPEQVQLKYAATLPGLREMGYIAVGAGKTEFSTGLYRMLDQYAAQKEQPPYTLAGNVVGLVGGKPTPRPEAFIGPGSRPMVGLAEVAEIGAIPVGIVGVVGPSVQKEVTALGGKSLVGFTPVKDALTAAQKELAAHQKKPALQVLLYQGTLEEARQVAKEWPQYAAIVCLSPDSQPPEEMVTVDGTEGRKTVVIQVGHKGRYVGVLGAFKRAAGGFDLKYELVPLGANYVTPGTEEAARKANLALPFLDKYAAQVRDLNLLAKFPELPPPAMAKNAKLKLAYVGSESCAKCHAAEDAKWKETLHSHAMDALEKTAKRPALRQFDGECVVCHTVGLGYKTGYRNESATPALKHVGCESCHGPGSGHAADPKDAIYRALQSPWRQLQTDRLPSPAALEAMSKLSPAERAATPLTAPERRMIGAVSRACISCHDTENDPHFDLASYWPKIYHAAKK